MKKSTENQQKIILLSYNHRVTVLGFPFLGFAEVINIYYYYY